MLDQQTLLLILGAVAAFFGGKTLVNVDTAIEDKKRSAIQLASWTSNNGLPILSRFLEAFAVGDKSGMISSFRDAKDLLSRPDDLKVTLDMFLKNQLAKRLDSTDTREEVLKFVEDRLKVSIPRG